MTHVEFKETNGTIVVAPIGRVWLMKRIDGVGREHVVCQCGESEVHVVGREEWERVRALLATPPDEDAVLEGLIDRALSGVEEEEI